MLLEVQRYPWVYIPDGKHELEIVDEVLVSIVFMCVLFVLGWLSCGFVFGRLGRRLTLGLMLILVKRIYLWEAYVRIGCLLLFWVSFLNTVIDCFGDSSVSRADSKHEQGSWWVGGIRFKGPVHLFVHSLRKFCRVSYYSLLILADPGKHVPIQVSCSCS